MSEDYTNEYEQQIENIDEEVAEHTLKSKQEILEDISQTLKVLEEQATQLSIQLETLSELNTTIVNLRQISDNLSQQVYADCLSEYKKVILNASKNYNQLQQAVSKWQKRIITEQEQTLKFMKYSSLITPILLLIFIIFQIL